MFAASYTVRLSESPVMVGLQAPTWLPYRIRSRWDQQRVLSATRRLQQTAPRSASTAESADAEIHMLLCRRDLRLGVLALKSLLRFPGTRLAVTITDDGTLTDTDRNWVDAHISGVRWLPRHVTDDRLDRALIERPCLASLYASSFSFSAKLVHPIVLARCERVIQMDADTAFFQEPTELIDWARGDETVAYYLHDVAEKEESVPAEVKTAFERFTDEASLPNGLLDHYYYNAGLLLYLRSQCNLSVAEAFLAWRMQQSTQLRSGANAVWFGEWTREQTAYLAMFAAMDPPARPLPSTYCLGSEQRGVFNHFMRYELVRPASLNYLSQLVRDLSR